MLQDVLWSCGRVRISFSRRTPEIQRRLPRLQSKNFVITLKLTFGRVKGNEYIELTTSNIGVANSESNEIRPFELLRNELIELEKRVQRSADQSENEEDIKVMNDGANHSDESRLNWSRFRRMKISLKNQLTNQKKVACYEPYELPPIRR